MKADNEYRLIIHRLNQLRMKLKVQGLFSGFLYTITLMGISLLILGWLESVFWFTAGWRKVFFIGFSITAICSVSVWILYRVYALLFLVNQPSDDDLSIKVGLHFPQINDRLTDALQVFRNHKEPETGTSEDLAAASLIQMEKEIRNHNFKDAGSWRKTFKRFRFFIPFWVVLFLIMFIFNHPLKSAWTRLVNPGIETFQPLPYSLILHPGHAQIIQGENVDIEVEAKGDLPGDIVLEIQKNDESIEEKVLKAPFRYRMTAVRNTFHYSAYCGKIKTPRYTIDVVQRPLIRFLQAQLHPPNYSRLPEKILDSNDGYIYALKGTRVQIHALANKWITHGSLIFDQSEEIQLKISGNQLAGSFMVQKEDHYQIQVLDSLGLANSNPISYPIRIQEDLFPLARIVFPETSQDLDESMNVNLTLEGEDDFGIVKMRLVYWVHPGGEQDTSQNKPNYQSLKLNDTEPQNALINFTWNLKDLNLFPEDVISYALEVWDNDNVSGPKMTRSQIQTLRFPSIYEIFQEVEKEQAYQNEKLSEVYQESQEIKEALDRLEKEIKIGEEMKWEEREILNDVTEKQKKMEENLESIQQNLEEMVDRMEQFDMIHPETLEKYQELQELYQEIGSQELYEAMKKLQESLKEMDKTDLQLALEQLQLSQDQFVKSMERTISLLKRIQIEQKVDEVIQRIDDLVERQTSLNQQLNQPDQGDKGELQKSQEGIQKDTGFLRKEMDDLHMKMENISNMPVNQLEQIIAQMDQEDLQKQMEEIMEKIKQGDMGQAGGKGSKVQQAMISLSNMLKMMQKQLQLNNKSRITREMNRITHRVIHLSYLQESLTQSLTRGEMPHRIGAQKQLSLISGLSQVADSLVDLSHQTFFISPKIGLAITDANLGMRQALEGLQQAGAQDVTGQQNRAMGGLNKCVLALQEAINRLSGSSSGFGMEDFLLQMEKMAQQQQSINQQTMDMLNQGQMSLQEQAAMSRLMAEQSALKNSLERMMNGVENRSDLQRRLGQMADEMKEVIRDFQNTNVRRETIQRQQRILSRLLDAQHAIRKREFSQQREARTGIDKSRKSPGDLERNDISWKEKMRRDILHMDEEGYTKVYQEWIRLYFEAVYKETETVN